MSIVSVENFTMTLPGISMGRTVLDDVSFSVAPGGCLGIVGESGSGKSLLTRSILGSVPTGSDVSGQISVDGVELIGSTAEERRRVRSRLAGIVFQDPRASVNPLHPIEDFLVESVIHTRRLSRADARARAIELLALMRIAEPERVLRSYPDELSGGMLQRVVIAAAMMPQPQVLICDEATTALDVTTQAEIVQLLARLRAETGVAVIFVTHDLDLAGDLCDEICVLYAGHVQEQGPARQVLEAPMHPYTRAVLAAIPRVTDPPGHRLPAISGTVLPLSADGGGCRFAGRCTVYDPMRCTLPTIPTVTVQDRAVRCVRAHS